MPETANYTEQLHRCLTEYVSLSTRGFQPTDYEFDQDYPVHTELPPGLFSIFNFEALLESGGALSFDSFLNLSLKSCIDKRLIDSIYHLVACLIFGNNSNDALAFAGEKTADKTYRDQIIHWGFAQILPRVKHHRISEPLVILAARIAFDRHPDYKFAHIACNAIKFVRDPASIGFAWEYLLAYYVSRTFEHPVQMTNAFYFTDPILEEHFRDTTIRLVALQNEGIKRSGWTASSNVALYSKADKNEGTAEWFKEPDGVSLFLPDKGLGPDLIGLFQVSDGTLLWIPFQAKIRIQDQQWSLLQLNKAADTLVPDLWWTQKKLDGKRKKVSLKYRTPLLKDLFLVSNLHEFPTPRYGSPVGKAVPSTGILRVLAIVGGGGDGEANLQTAKRVGYQGRFPLAIFRLDGVQEMLGAGLWAKMNGLDN
jgi:hypothetical protein